MDFSEEEFSEILKIFNDESDEITQRLTTTLIQIEKEPDNKDELLNILFRDAHSLKGAARMIGFNCIQKLAHLIEDILGLAKDNQLVINSEISDLLLKTIDYCKYLISNSVNMQKEFCDDDFNDYTESLQKVTSMFKEKNLLSEKSNSNNSDESKPYESKPVQNNDVPLNNSALTTDKVTSIENIEKKLPDINFNNWQEIFACISELDFIIHQLLSYSENYKLIDIIKNFNRILKLFSENKLNDEVKKIEAILEKLNFIQKASGVLNKSDIEYLSCELAKIYDSLINKSKLSGFEIPIYNYNYTSEENNDIKLDENKNNLYFDNLIKTTIENINLLKNNLDILPDIKNSIIEILNNQKNSEEKSNILNKVLELINKIDKSQKYPNNEIIDILTQSLISLESSLDGVIDNTLLDQRLTIANQMIDYSKNLPVSKNNQYLQNSNSKFQKLNDFISAYDNSSIKTLRVDTDKLDKLVNQVSELISSKIKTKSELQELLKIQHNFESWQIFSNKSLNYIKYYERKLSYGENKTDFDSISNFIKQLFHLFKENTLKVHELTNQLSSLYRTIQDNEVKYNQIINEIEQMVRNIRVLPMATVFHTFPRMVRDISTQSGKEIELFILGSEITADKKIIEEIKSPLIHIIRNAIDHGIETPQERLNAHKSKVGKIYISAKHIENQIVIEVRDDGRGVNLAKIKEKVLKKNLLTQQEIDSMSDEQIMNIIFWPGFSTGEKVTDISGRGIGLDVVQTKISQLNGKVSVTSTLGKGSNVKIELPTSMTTLKAFIFKIKDQYFAIPMSLISLVKFIKSEEIIKKENYSSIIINNEIIPIFNLASVLKIKVDYEKQEKMTVIIVESDNTKIGFIVDSIVGDKDIIHNKLPDPILKLNNISGITNLASGHLCLILNISGIIKNSFINNNKNNLLINANKDITSKVKLKKENEKINILFIDDSQTIQSFIKNLLKPIGYNIELASNGKEALSKLSQVRYDLIITDYEMPKINGYEFINRIKSDEMYHRIPIIVLTSIDDDRLREDLMNIGVTSYLIKNSDTFKNLNNEIRKILDKQNEY